MSGQYTVAEDDIVVFQGFDHAYLGSGQRAGGQAVACYSKSRIIALLMDKHGIDISTATRIFNREIGSADIGGNTPIIVDDLQPYQICE